jgi:hypothetical protein
VRERSAVVRRLLLRGAMKQTLFAIALLVAACKGNDSTPSASSGPSSSEALKSAEGKPAPVPEASPPFVSGAGRYTAKVTFGAVTEKTMDDPNGGTWRTAKWNTPRGLFMVQYADYADHATAKAETMVGFIPTRDKSAIKRDDPIKVGDREGRAVEWAVNPTTMMYMRFIIDDKRVYKLGAGTKGDRETVTKFFDGFEITAAK